MNYFRSILIVVFVVLTVKCAVRKAVTYEFPAAMSLPIQAEFANNVIKGRFCTI